MINRLIESMCRSPNSLEIYFAVLNSKTQVQLSDRLIYRLGSIRNCDKLDKCEFECHAVTSEGETKPSRYLRSRSCFRFNAADSVCR